MCSNVLLPYVVLFSSVVCFRNNELLDGTVSWVHQYVDMSKAQVKMDDGTTVSTCKPGMGYRLIKITVVLFFICSSKSLFCCNFSGFLR